LRTVYVRGWDDDGDYWDSNLVGPAITFGKIDMLS